MFEKLAGNSPTEMIVEFYESGSFTEFNDLIQEDSKPIKTITLKEGQQPQKIKIDTSDLSGFNILVRSPRAAGLFFNLPEGVVTHYNLIMSEGTLTYE